jgi:hypothetical protein
MDGTPLSNSPKKRTAGTTRLARYSARKMAASSPSGTANKVASPTIMPLPATALRSPPGWLSGPSGSSGLYGNGSFRKKSRLSEVVPLYRM